MTQATDDVYYLYVGTGWSGPFRVEQIRLFVKEKQIAPDTYAFEPQQQMQLTVAQLLADPSEADTGSYQNPTAPPAGRTTTSIPSKGESQDARRTLLKQAQNVSTGANSADADVIDLDAVGTSATRARQDDSDVIDLDKVGTSGSGAGKQDDSDVIDLDAMATSRTGKNTLKIEIDEPRGRPAESTVHSRAQSSEALEVVLGELETLRKAYNALMEDSIKDHEDAQQKVHVAHLAINEVLEERKSDVAEIRSLVAEIDEVATDLAKKHHDSTLSTRIVRLRDSLQESDVAQMVQFAEAVLRRIVEQYDSRSTRAGAAAGEENPFASFDAVSATRGGTEAAKRELAAALEAQRELRERLAREQDAARERLLSATTMLEAERTLRSQDQGELRALVTEIYRLACEIDPQWMSRQLYGRVQELWKLLAVPDQGTPASAMAPVADQVLQGMLQTLTERALNAPDVSIEGAHEGGTQRRLAAERAQELSTVRAELLQSRTDLSLLRQRSQSLEEEKARVQRLLDDQKLVAEKAQHAAKAREQRLRSTVTALEVTKELHQEVMRDLQTQLGAAQAKVEAMELDLRDVRGQLTARRERRESGDDLQAEMRRVVEMRAMLDARKEELSADLKSTQAELDRVKSAAEGDQELAEALAAKVTHLRHTYEQTLARLTDQEGKAQTLTQALDESRREAGLLRGRSDDLSTELVEARSNLSSARKRVEELALAYERLENERQSLARELTTRRTTTTIYHAGAGDAAELQPPQDEVHDEAALNARLSEQQLLRSTAETELAREKRRAEDLGGQLHALQSRITELTLDRDHLKLEHDRLLESQASEHHRLNAALATATQATIEAEGRQRHALARIAALESELAASAGEATAPAAHAAGAPAPQPGTTRVPTPTSVKLAQSTAAELSQLRADRERHVAELQEARAAHQAALGLLADAKAAVTAASQQAASNDAAVAREAAEKKLAAAERDLKSAGTQRESLRSRYSAVEAECERLRREQESAAAEHRAALQSARNRFADAQARVEGLEHDVAELRLQSQVLTSEREELRASLGGAAAEAQAHRADANAQRAKLQASEAELGQAHERLKDLSERLAAHEVNAAISRERMPELEAKLMRSQAERSQLLGELDRLRSEIVTFTQQRDGSGSADALKAALAKLQDAKGAQDAQLAAALATCERLTEQVASLAAAAAAQAEKDAEVQNRLAVASSRAQTAEELLSAAREQQRATAAALDSATLGGARLEAERSGLVRDIARLRAELDQVRAAATVREGSPMSAAVTDAAIAERLRALERDLESATRRVRELEANGTGRHVARLSEELTRSRSTIAALEDRLRLTETGKAAAMASERIPAQSVPAAKPVAAKPRAYSFDATAPMPAMPTPTAADPSAPSELVPALVPAMHGKAVTLPEEDERPQVFGTRFTASHGRLPGPGTSQMTGALTALQTGAHPGPTPRFARDRVPTAFLPGPNAHALQEPTVRTEIGNAAPSALEPAPGATPAARRATGGTTAANAAIADPAAPGTGSFSRFHYRTVSPQVAETWGQTVRARWEAISLQKRWAIGLGVGAGVCVLALWKLAMGLPGSSDAVVNANVTILKSPIEGTVQDLGVSTGAAVASGQTVVHVHNDLVDETRLHELTLALKEATDAKATAAGALADAQHDLADKTAQAAMGKAQAMATAQAARTAASDALTSATETEKLRELVLSTLESIAATGRLSDADLAPARAQAAAAQATITAAKAALASADDVLAAAQKDDAKAQAEVEAAKEAVDHCQSQFQSQLDAIASGTKAIASEQEHLAALRDSELAAPLTGPVWLQKATAGTPVQAGSPVLEIADPATIAVEAVFDGAARGDVHVGDAVRVRLPASNLLVDGRVTAILADAPTVPRAQDFGPLSSDALRVSIALDTDIPKSQLLGQGCNAVVIGNHSMLGSMVGWLYFRMKF
jgi:chromosome segregation ATPase